MTRQPDRTEPRRKRDWLKWVIIYLAVTCAASWAVAVWLLTQIGTTDDWRGQTLPELIAGAMISTTLLVGFIAFRANRRKENADLTPTVSGHPRATLSWSERRAAARHQDT